MTELDITLPSIRHVHRLIQDQYGTDSPQSVEIKLVTGDMITGTVKWIDVHCICVDGAQSGNPHTMLIWHHAIAYIKS
jgi:host factor-I protein